MEDKKREMSLRSTKEERVNFHPNQEENRVEVGGQRETGTHSIISVLQKQSDPSREGLGYLERIKSSLGSIKEST